MCRNCLCNTRESWNTFCRYLGHTGHVEQRFLSETDSSLQPRNYQTMRGQGMYGDTLEFHSKS